MEEVATLQKKRLVSKKTFFYRVSKKYYSEQWKFDSAQ